MIPGTKSHKSKKTDISGLKFQTALQKQKPADMLAKAHIFPERKAEEKMIYTKDETKYKVLKK